MHLEKSKFILGDLFLEQLDLVFSSLFKKAFFASVAVAAHGARTTGPPCTVGHLCMPPHCSATFWVVMASPSACCQHPSNCTMPHDLHG